MTDKEIFEEIQATAEELRANRRFLHAHAEVGFALRETKAFICARLQEMGYAPKTVGRSGVLATINGDFTFPTAKRVLLRADADALPILEKSSEPFRCKRGNMHACGHDLHTATLLGAARFLKAHERELAGEVRLLFQPAEEILEGAKACIEDGVTKGVDGAFALHVAVDTPLKTGTLLLPPSGVSAPAADYFTIEVKGKGCHGSAPQNGVDALSVASYILLALQEIPARELSPAQPAVLTVGKMLGGEAGNAIAQTASLQGTLRAFDGEVRARIKKRLREIASGVAQSFRAKAKISFGGGCPTLVNDGGMVAFTKEIFGDRAVSVQDMGAGFAARNGGSEDFAYISHEVPSVMIALAAGAREQGYKYPLHHPKVRFDEDALVYGAYAYATFAYRALQKDG